MLDEISEEFKKDEEVDWKEIRHYLPLSSDCFESVYLGVNILPRNRAKIIDVAKKFNPNIKINQMTLDPEALRLKEKTSKHIKNDQYTKT